MVSKLTLPNQAKLRVVMRIKRLKVRVKETKLTKKISLTDETGLTVEVDELVVSQTVVVPVQVVMTVKNLMGLLEGAEIDQDVVTGPTAT